LSNRILSRFLEIVGLYLSTEEVTRSRGQIKKRGAKKKNRGAKKKTGDLAKPDAP
jgi:hypothetical protein